jgi:hypothetical protein
LLFLPQGPAAVSRSAGFHAGAFYKKTKAAAAPITTQCKTRKASHWSKTARAVQKKITVGRRHDYTVYLYLVSLKYTKSIFLL